MEGNERFLSDRGHSHGLLSESKALHQATQTPFAVVLTCADSRVAPEILFDAGLGELFVIRVAGNVANPSTIGSIEYAVQYLGTPLVLVLGHTHCGAICAAMSGERESDNLGILLDFIEPALGPQDVDEVAIQNTRVQVERILAESAIVREAEVEVLRGLLHFENGRVDLLP
jgi:carbonic anhydrase